MGIILGFTFFIGGLILIALFGAFVFHLWSEAYWDHKERKQRYEINNR